MVAITIGIGALTWHARPTSTVQFASAAGSSTSWVPDPADLPDDFDQYHVEIEQQGQLLVIRHDSPLLGLRANTLVFVPDAYLQPGHAALGTAYWLHGTYENAIQSAINDVTSFSDAGLYELPYDAYDFLLVYVDGGAGWCLHCFWVDGRDGQGWAAESHLYQEVIPLIEALFGVRTDAGGRAVLGHSMGGSGALIQGFRHPDRFAYIGASSPSIMGEAQSALLDEVIYAGYMIDQGYGPPVSDEIHYRNINPYELATSMNGQGADIVVVHGDGCLDNEEGDCAGQDPDQDEAIYRAWSTQAMERWTELGVPYTHYEVAGRHNTHVPTTLREIFVPGVQAAFARQPVSAPQQFSYRTVDRTFEVWGWQVAVERPNEEFLQVLGARTDGRAVTLAGTGVATISTPATFQPGRAYDVEITTQDGTRGRRTVMADEDGRLSLELDLGPTRTQDERYALVQAGAFPFPHTNVRVW